jgi:dienelactone hydrolase
MKLTYAILMGLLLSYSTLAAGQSLRDRIINNHYAYVPGEGQRFPALIAMPGCSGISSDNPEAERSNPDLREDDLVFRRHFREEAEKLKREGFVVLLMNIHEAEGLLTACGGKIDNERMAQYVNESIAWARGLPFVDPDHIHLIGWSMGGRAVLKWLQAPRSEAENVRSTIAVYPDCAGLETLTISMPVLMLLGGSDDIAVPSVCEALVDKAPIKQHLIVEKYQGARHGFDVVNAPPIMDIGGGMTIGYQQQAADASWQAILNFLAPRD